MNPRRAPASSGPRPEASMPPGNALARLGWPMVGLLAVQFLLGIALNLFVVLPSGTVVAILDSSPVLILHLVVAVLLIGIAAFALFLALRLRQLRAVAAGALALVSAVVATVAGVSFAFGPPTAGASFAMSVGFVGMLTGAAMLLAPGALPVGRDATHVPPSSNEARSEP